MPTLIWIFIVAAAVITGWLWMLLYRGRQARHRARRRESEVQKTAKIVQEMMLEDRRLKVDDADDDATRTWDNMPGDEQ